MVNIIELHFIYVFFCNFALSNRKIVVIKVNYLS